MPAEELKKRIDLLNRQGKMLFVAGATEEQIKQFEDEHKLQLPLKYKEWLLFSDGGDCFLPAGVQFYGVAHTPVIDVDDDNRPDDSYVVIGSLATGDPIIFKRNEESISIFNHEGGRIENDETYTDFFAFIDDLSEVLGIGG